MTTETYGQKLAVNIKAKTDAEAARIVREQREQQEKACAEREQYKGKLLPMIEQLYKQIDAGKDKPRVRIQGSEFDSWIAKCQRTAPKQNNKPSFAASRPGFRPDNWDLWDDAVAGCQEQGLKLEVVDESDGHTNSWHALVMKVL